jgi:hypothetical protein
MQLRRVCHDTLPWLISFSLDPMLDEYIDWYRASMALAYLVIDVYMLCLWSFAFRRTRLGFLRLLVITNVLLVLVSLVHVVITLTEEKLKMDVFGPHAYANFAHTEYVIRPFISVANVVAYTLLARWLLHTPHTIAPTKV